MEPSRRISHPAFAFVPANPNPNFTFSHPGLIPNINFVPENPNPNPTFTFGLPPTVSVPRPPPQPPRDVGETASLLKSLIDRAEQTVEEVTSLLRLKKPLERNEFSSCPYDSRHRMPPENLFLHSLRCPSAPGVVDPADLPSVNYRSSLKSESELPSGSHFFGLLEESGGDLCLSLDDETGYNANFFYRDCPGVAGPSADVDMKRIFTLPSVLSAECVNFGRKELDSRDHGQRFLPSEFWELKRQVEGWTDYPVRCSFYVQRAVLCLGNLKEVDAKKWIILNSPLHGIVIDVEMRDHLFLLLKLCLRAMLRNVDCSMIDNSKNSCSDCPVLFEILSWLGSQLTILYGQVNGKFFAINMVKHSLLSVARSVLLFRIANEFKIEGSHLEDGSGAGLDASEIKNCSDRGGKDDEEVLDHGELYVSQIAAAVAALFERSSLEENIKGLRLSGALSKFQRLSEHAHVSNKADEVRGKRLEYRPIIEHDGLLWQRSRDQDDGSKIKTREEILAEERDYKRRRMSYRGKKVKRTSIQVLRDIIEDHMDEIARAGGIGCFAKGAAERGVPPPAADAHQSKSSAYCASERNRTHSQDNAMFVRTDSNVSYGKEEFDLGRDQTGTHFNLELASNAKWNGTTLHYKHQMNSLKILSKDKQDRHYRSRSPHGETSNREHLDRHEHGKRQGHLDVHRTKNDHKKSVYSSRVEHSGERLYSSSKRRMSSEGRFIQRIEGEDRRSMRMCGTSSSKSTMQDVLEDRYDPSLSYDTENDGCDYYRSK